MDTILWYLIPSLVMFCCGVYGFITRRNLRTPKPHRPLAPIVHPEKHERAVAPFSRK